jgi:hypothetical protein
MVGRKTYAAFVLQQQSTPYRMANKRSTMLHKIHDRVDHAFSPSGSTNKT